jgi:hypothetical protein
MAKYTFHLGDETYDYEGDLSRTDALKEVATDITRDPEVMNKAFMESDPATRAYNSVKEASDESGPIGKFFGGVGGAQRRAGEGIRQLIPGLDDPSEETMAETRGMEANFLGQQGGIFGDAATFVAPGAAVETALIKGLSNFPKAKTAVQNFTGRLRGRTPRPTGAAPAGPLAKATQSLLPAAVTGAGEMGLQPVMEGESRLKNMAMGGGLAALPGVGLRVSRRAARPMEASPPAQAQFDKGYDMSLGQATQDASGMGGLINLGEEASAAIPGLGSGIKANRELYGNQIVREASERGFPEGPPPGILPSRDTAGSDAGYFGINEEQFNRAYPEIMGDKVMPMSLPELGTARASARRIANKSGKRDRERLSEDLNAHMKRTMTGDEWKRADTRFRNRINEYWDKYKRTGDQGDMEMVSAYRSARDSLTETRDKVFTPTEVAALTKLDQQYAVSQQLKRAADQPDLGPGRAIEARNLVREVEQDTPLGLKVKGRGRLQDLTDPSADIIAQELGDNPQQRRRGMQQGMALLGAVSLGSVPGAVLGGSAITSKPGVARFMTGQSNRQKAIAEALRKGNENLYKFPVMGGVGFMGAKELEKELEE